MWLEYELCDYTKDFFFELYMKFRYGNGGGGRSRVVLFVNLLYQ